jgi:hypothetical protein
MKADVGDGRVGQHALDVGLRDGDQVAQPHGEHGEDHQHPLPIRLDRLQPVHQHANRQREGGDLGRTAEQQDGRRRRALVDVRHPHVEGHGAELEADADDQEDDPEDQDLVVHPLLGDRLCDRTELDRAGGAVDHGDAVEQHARAERAQHEILHRRLGALLRVAVEGDQGIETERLKLETEIDGQEAVGRDHDQHPEHREEPQDVELADEQPRSFSQGRA